MFCEEVSIQCPYCLEVLWIEIQPEDLGQRFVYDCEVCCRPIHIQVFKDSVNDTWVASAQSEDEV